LQSSVFGIGGILQWSLEFFCFAATTQIHIGTCCIFFPRGSMSAQESKGRRPMQVKLRLKRLKSIEPVKSDQGLTITYVASSQQLGELELKIVTGMHADLNAAEQEARKTIEAFVTGLRIATESNPLVGQ
jgi:hypothetical protein